MKYSEVEQWLLSQDITPVFIVFHGSIANNMSGPSSDMDFWVATRSEERSIPTIREDGEKWHVECHTVEHTESAMKGFEDFLLHAILDLNSLAGRLMMGKIVHDPDGVGKGILGRYIPYRPTQTVLKKFIYQSYGFLQDASHPNGWVSSVCQEKAIDSMIVAFLLSHRITYLNTKWQPFWMAQIAPGALFEQYVEARFNVPLQNGRTKRFVEAVQSEVRMAYTKQSG